VIATASIRPLSEPRIAPDASWIVAGELDGVGDGNGGDAAASAEKAAELAAELGAGALAVVLGVLRTRCVAALVGTATCVDGSADANAGVIAIGAAVLAEDSPTVCGFAPVSAVDGLPVTIGSHVEDRPTSPSEASVV
jgi:hypothetical protein